MNEYKPSKSTASEIERLAGATVTVTSAVIAEAQKQIAEANERAAIERAKSEILEIEGAIENKVDELRTARATAKNRENELGKLVDAQKQYAKDGDYSAFSKVLRQVSGW